MKSHKMVNSTREYEFVYLSNLGSNVDVAESWGLKGGRGSDDDVCGILRVLCRRPLEPQTQHQPHFIVTTVRVPNYDLLLTLLSFCRGTSVVIVPQTFTSPANSFCQCHIQPNPITLRPLPSRRQLWQCSNEKGVKGSVFSLSRFLLFVTCRHWPCCLFFACASDLLHHPPDPLFCTQRHGRLPNLSCRY